jgi:hypothetical protein
MTGTTQHNIAIFSGDSQDFNFSVTDAAAAATDLTGAAVKFKISRSPQSAAIIVKTIGAGITITNALGGLFKASLVASDTNNLNGKFYFQAQVTDSGGNRSVISHGAINFKPQIREN